MPLAREQVDVILQQTSGFVESLSVELLVFLAPGDSALVSWV